MKELSVGRTDEDSWYLFAPAVKGGFHLPPRLGVVTPLHQGVVMGILQRHPVPPVFRLLQPVEVAVGHSTWGKTTRVSGGGVSRGDGRGSARTLTQLTLGKLEGGRVLVQVSVKLDAQFTYQFGGFLYFLGKQANALGLQEGTAGLSWVFNPSQAVVIGGCG